MTWLKETGQYALKYHSWPNPAKNMVTKFERLACESPQQFKLKFALSKFGFWAWDTFFPSPVELTRKFATGAYKCGFFLPFVQPASPLDIIWQDGRTSQALMEISSPITKALYYLWVTESIFGAMSTWSSIIYTMETCDSDRYEALLRDGDAALPPGVHQGGPVFGTVMWDPNDWVVENDCTIIVPEEKNVRASAFGYLNANGHPVNAATISISDSNGPLVSVETGPLGANDSYAWNLEYAARRGAGALFIVVDYDIGAGPVANAHIVLTRFTVRETPIDIPNGSGTIDAPEPPGSLHPCTNLQEFYDSM